MFLANLAVPLLVFVSHSCRQSATIENISCKELLVKEDRTPSVSDSCVLKMFVKKETHKLQHAAPDFGAISTYCKQQRSFGSSHELAGVSSLQECASTLLLGATCTAWAAGLPRAFSDAFSSGDIKLPNQSIDRGAMSLNVGLCNRRSPSLPVRTGSVEVIGQRFTQKDLAKSQTAQTNRGQLDNQGI